MFEKFSKVLKALELEEKILHAGVALCTVGLFVPWLGGQWYGKDQQWNGFGFYTGFIGQFAFLVQMLIVAMTLSPLLGGPVIVRKSIRNFVRLLLSAMTSILMISCFTILFRLTSEVSGAEIRFGIYVSIVGSVLATLYSFLKYDEQRKSEVEQLFHHPDQQSVKKVNQELLDEGRPPLPPPPPPMPAEEHSIYKL